MSAPDVEKRRVLARRRRAPTAPGRPARSRTHATPSPTGPGVGRRREVAGYSSSRGSLRGRREQRARRGSVLRYVPTLGFQRQPGLPTRPTPRSSCTRLARAAERVGRHRRTPADAAVEHDGGLAMERLRLRPSVRSPADGVRRRSGRRPIRSPRGRRSAGSSPAAVAPRRAPARLPSAGTVPSAIVEWVNWSGSQRAHPRRRSSGRGRVRSWPGWWSTAPGRCGSRAPGHSFSARRGHPRARCSRSTRLARVLDADGALVRVEAGIRLRALSRELHAARPGDAEPRRHRRPVAGRRALDRHARHRARSSRTSRARSTRSSSSSPTAASARSTRAIF